jgi:DNA replication and repair protein RecF
MYLKNLKLINFKNYSEADISFSNKLNCFTGLNGSGKTNLLDAVYYLSFTKSYFNTSDLQNIKYENDFFVIQGDFILNDRNENIYCGYKKNKKKTFKRNDKIYTKYSEHIGLIPTVIISPDDNKLIIGASEERRKYIDSVISQYDIKYLNSLIRYNKTLLQRNKLLRDFAKHNYFDIDSLEIYNEQLIAYGEYIFTKRNEFIKNLLPIFMQNHEFISQNKETVSLKYKSQLGKTGFKELLYDSLAKDRVLQYTSSGIHRDDLTFKINHSSLKKTGSQGQQKTFLIALKFAQFKFIKEISSIKPILLLDDIFDKFDSERVEKIIMTTLNDDFGQIFITDTNPERLKKIIEENKSDYKFFDVNNAEISEHIN